MNSPLQLARGAAGGALLERATRTSRITPITSGK